MSIAQKRKRSASFDSCYKEISIYNNITSEFKDVSIKKRELTQYRLDIKQDKYLELFDKVLIHKNYEFFEFLYKNSMFASFSGYYRTMTDSLFYRYCKIQDVKRVFSIMIKHKKCISEQDVISITCRTLDSNLVKMLIEHIDPKTKTIFLFIDLIKLNNIEILSSCANDLSIVSEYSKILHRENGWSCCQCYKCCLLPDILVECRNHRINSDTKKYIDSLLKEIESGLAILENEKKAKEEEKKAKENAEKERIRKRNNCYKKLYDCKNEDDRRVDLKENGEILIITYTPDFGEFGQDYGRMSHYHYVYLVQVLIMKNDMENLEYLITDGIRDINAKVRWGDENKFSDDRPIQVAIKLESVEGILMLIKHGAIVEEKDINKIYSMKIDPEQKYNLLVALIKLNVITNIDYVKLRNNSCDNLIYVLCEKYEDHKDVHDNESLIKEVYLNLISRRDFVKLSDIAIKLEDVKTAARLLVEKIPEKIYDLPDNEVSKMAKKLFLGVYC